MPMASFHLLLPYMDVRTRPLRVAVPVVNPTGELRNERIKKIEKKEKKHHPATIIIIIIKQIPNYFAMKKIIT